MFKCVGKSLFSDHKIDKKQWVGEVSDFPHAVSLSRLFRACDKFLNLDSL
jgi:hypothetical protein